MPLSSVTTRAVPRVGQKVRHIVRSYLRDAPFPLEPGSVYTVRQVFVWPQGLSVWDVVELEEKPGVIYAAARFEAT